MIGDYLQGVERFSLERLEERASTRGHVLHALSEAERLNSLGRFAAAYRARYGELPSTTLRRRHGVAELTLGRPRVNFP